MSDEGFDPCECMWGHEMSMRRLLNMLRNSQSDCTDTVCYTPPRNESLGDESNLMFMTLCICVALFMYYIAPRNTSARPEPTKSRLNWNDSDGTPPTPPPAAT